MKIEKIKFGNLVFSYETNKERHGLWNAVKRSKSSIGYWYQHKRKGFWLREYKNPV